MSNPMENFNWNYINSLKSVKLEAQALIKLAIELESEPNRFAGKLRIYDWLDENHASFDYHKMVRELEVEYYNHKNFQSQRGLFDL